MTKILFVCHGNICRSPMAQYIMAQMVKEAGLSEEYEIDSAATSTEEIGNPVYPPTKRLLSLNGITGIDHRARQITMKDYNHFDQIYVMDRNNFRNIMHLIDNDPQGKVSMLLENEDIEDPWYTDNYEKVYEMIKRGCKRILAARGE